MSNGLNQRFMRDPVTFLSSYWDINSAQPQHGEGYGIDANGIANLDLSEYSPQTVRVSKAETGLLASLSRETPVRAYYLTSRVDRTMAMPLGSDCDFFFTDAITGCQFMAYGNTRHNITVCHVNALTQGAPIYNAEAALVQNATSDRDHLWSAAISGGPAAAGTSACRSHRYRLAARRRLAFLSTAACESAESALGRRRGGAGALNQ